MKKVTVAFGARRPRAERAQHPWSQQQQVIFDWAKVGRGNLLVRARAGTGKSTTIRELVELAPERQILVAAFNKDIARDMEARVSNPCVEVKTLHGLGLKYVRRNWQVKVEETKSARAAALARRAAPDAPEEVQRLVRHLHTKAREILPLAASGVDLQALAVRFDLVPDPEWIDQNWGLGQVCAAAHRAMIYAKERTSEIDFADMIFLPLAHGWVRPWFDMVVVDEAQDMTDSQLKIAVGACRRGGRVVVVGDDRQAIYSFRGADSGSLDRLKASLGAQELGLTVTYRCGSQIVALAREIVPDYEAVPGAHEGEIKACDVEEMIDVAAEGDFIISRVNAPLVKTCMALLKRGVRARVKGRDLGKGIVALIRRLGARQVTDVAPGIDTWCRAEIEAAESIVDESTRQERLEQVIDQRDVVLALLEGASTVAELEARVEEMFSDAVERRAVTCSTVHRAKGLETERVFLLKDTFRSGRLEEDNLRYVAITRAKQTLVWVS